MDDTVSVILLLTGFCVPVADFSDAYYFIGKEMKWDEARAYCKSEFTELAQIFDSKYLRDLMETPTRGYTGKAWLGLYENSTKWFWMDKQVATYNNWAGAQPDNANASEFCAAINSNGSWNDANCSEMKPFVCVISDDHNNKNGSSSYQVKGEGMTWTDAKIYCEKMGSVLVSIPDNTTNSDVTAQLSGDEEAWIGLSRPELWYWSFTKGRYLFINWQDGQPDNLYGRENCAAIVVEEGTWTDEQCQEKYPFFCFGGHMEADGSGITVVSMRIRSRANVEDPAFIADLQDQLYAAFANQGVTDIKLTWKKLPVMQTQESTDVKDTC